MPSHYGTGLKTLRGTLSNVGQDNQQDLILSYDSPDRTKGWIVEDAWMWISNPFSTISNDSNLMLMGSLTTEFYPPANTAIQSPDDNRAIGWMTKQYIGRNASVDFFLPNAVSLTGCDFLLDLDRIVTNDLYINARAYDSSSTSVTVEVGYMIVLRQVKLQPTESVLQQLKGVGQDIEN